MEDKAVGISFALTYAIEILLGGSFPLLFFVMMAIVFGAYLILASKKTIELRPYKKIAIIPTVLVLILLAVMAVPMISMGPMGWFFLALFTVLAIVELIGALNKKEN